MSDKEVQQILQTMVELAHTLGWKTCMVQDPDGALRGVYMGEEHWVAAKSGTGKIRH